MTEGLADTPRIVSLLPAATEIVGALGLADSLVGISHECDFPPVVNDRPRVTHCPIHNAGLASADVDRWVEEALQENGTLYTLDESLMHELRPDVILTQKLCDVCAVGYGSVAAMAGQLPGPPRVINLEPSSLGDILENIRTVARVAGVPERGETVTSRLEARVDAVRARAATAGTRPRCYLMEWVDPPYSAGHWNPELVEIAGAFDPLGRKGARSARVSWERVVAARPDVLVLALCGWSVERSRDELPILQSYPHWDELPAVQHGRVYATDGSAYFSRPGPRVVEGLELLAGIVHPDIFPEFAPSEWESHQVARLEVAAHPHPDAS